MKLRLTLMIAALAIPTSAATAQTSAAPSIPDVAHYQYTVDGSGAGNRGTERISNHSLWRIRTLALRHEALELQRQDGGTLTPEHHAMLQAKLDRINAQARRH